MTFLPRGMTRVELVLAVAGLAHALILLLILAGLHWRSTRATSAALVLTLGARGLKISKTLGLGIRTGDGRLLPVDTPLLDPVWAVAAELRMPIYDLPEGLTTRKSASGKATAAAPAWPWMRNR